MSNTFRLISSFSIAVSRRKTSFIISKTPMFLYFPWLINMRFSILFEMFGSRRSIWLQVYILSHTEVCIFSLSDTKYCMACIPYLRNWISSYSNTLLHRSTERYNRFLFKNRHIIKLLNKFN